MNSNLQLSGNRSGRILLHLACIVRRGRFSWHFRGIVRELGIKSAGSDGRN